MLITRRVLSVAPLAAALLVAAATPRAATAGPPWIGVELPVNPHDPATRGALAVVRLYHHGTPTAWPLEARAVGSAGGRPQHVPLIVQRLATGSFAVRGTLPAGDGWVLVLTMQAGPSARASALVALDRRGDVVGVRVPQETIENGRWVNPREARVGEVDAMLRRAVADAGPTDVPARVDVGSSARTPRWPEPGGALAGAALAVLAPLGVRHARRPRR